MTLTRGKAKNPGMSMVGYLEDCLDMSCTNTLLEEVIEEKGNMCIFGAKFRVVSARRSHCSGVMASTTCGRSVTFT